MPAQLVEEADSSCCHDPRELSIVGSAAHWATGRDATVLVCERACSVIIMLVHFPSSTDGSVLNAAYAAPRCRRGISLQHPAARVTKVRPSGRAKKNPISEKFLMKTTIESRGSAFRELDFEQELKTFYI